MKFTHKNGEVILIGDSISLKVDTKRDIYIKNNSDSIFTKSDIQTQPNLTKFQKEKLLHELYTYVVEEIANEKSTVAEENTNEDE